MEDIFEIHQILLGLEKKLLIAINIETRTKVWESQSSTTNFMLESR